VLPAVYSGSVREEIVGTAQEGWLRFVAMELEERPFEHPVFWAAFAYTGL
jgi:CHAT domain-containing protein